jgi:hypothetical protein
MRRLTFLLGASMILLGALFIALGAWYFEKEGAKQFLFEIGIAALSAGMVGLVYNSVVRSDFLDQVKGQLEKILNADAPRLGIKHIYETRTTKNDDVKLPHLIDQARSEIMFVALGLHTVIHSHQRPLIKAIAKNVKIRFLIFNVESPNAKILDQTLGERNLANTLKGSFSKVLCLGQ